MSNELNELISSTYDIAKNAIEQTHKLIKANNEESAYIILAENTLKQIAKLKTKYANIVDNNKKLTQDDQKKFEKIILTIKYIIAYCEKLLLTNVDKIKDIIITLVKELYGEINNAFKSSEFNFDEANEKTQIMKELINILLQKYNDASIINSIEEIIKQPETIKKEKRKNKQIIKIVDDIEKIRLIKKTDIEEKITEHLENIDATGDVNDILSELIKFNYENIDIQYIIDIEKEKIINMILKKIYLGNIPTFIQQQNDLIVDTITFDELYDIYIKIKIIKLHFSKDIEDIEKKINERFNNKIKELVEKSKKFEDINEEIFTILKFDISSDDVINLLLYIITYGKEITSSSIEEGKKEEGKKSIFANFFSKISKFKKQTNVKERNENIDIKINDLYKKLENIAIDDKDKFKYALELQVLIENYIEDKSLYENQLKRATSSMDEINAKNADIIKELTINYANLCVSTIIDKIQYNENNIDDNMVIQVKSVKNAMKNLENKYNDDDIKYELKKDIYYITTSITLIEAFAFDQAKQEKIIAKQYIDDAKKIIKDMQENQDKNITDIDFATFKIANFKNMIFRSINIIKNALDISEITEIQDILYDVKSHEKEDILEIEKKLAIAKKIFISKDKQTLEKEIDDLFNSRTAENTNDTIKNIINILIENISDENTLKDYQRKLSYIDSISYKNALKSISDELKKVMKEKNEKAAFVSIKKLQALQKIDDGIINIDGEINKTIYNKKKEILIIKDENDNKAEINKLKEEIDKNIDDCNTANSADKIKIFNDNFIKLFILSPTIKLNEFNKINNKTVFNTVNNFTVLTSLDNIINSFNFNDFNDVINKVINIIALLEFLKQNEYDHIQEILTKFNNLVDVFTKENIQKLLNNNDYNITELYKIINIRDLINIAKNTTITNAKIYLMYLIYIYKYKIYDHNKKLYIEINENYEKIAIINKTKQEVLPILNFNYDKDITEINDINSIFKEIRTNNDIKKFIGGAIKDDVSEILTLVHHIVKLSKITFNREIIIIILDIIYANIKEEIDQTGVVKLILQANKILEKIDAKIDELKTIETKLIEGNIDEVQDANIKDKVYMNEILIIILYLFGNKNGDILPKIKEQEKKIKETIMVPAFTEIETIFRAIDAKIKSKEEIKKSLTIANKYLLINRSDKYKSDILKKYETINYSIEEEKLKTEVSDKKVKLEELITTINEIISSSKSNKIGNITILLENMNEKIKNSEYEQKELFPTTLKTKKEINEKLIELKTDIEKKIIEEKKKSEYEKTIEEDRRDKAEKKIFSDIEDLVKYVNKKPQVLHEDIIKYISERINDIKQKIDDIKINEKTNLLDIVDKLDKLDKYLNYHYFVFTTRYKEILTDLIPKYKEIKENIKANIINHYYIKIIDKTSSNLGIFIKTTMLNYNNYSKFEDVATIYKIFNEIENMKKKINENKVDTTITQENLQIINLITKLLLIQIEQYFIIYFMVYIFFKINRIFFNVSRRRRSPKLDLSTSDTGEAEDMTSEDEEEAPIDKISRPKATSESSSGAPRANLIVHDDDDIRFFLIKLLIYSSNHNEDLKNSFNSKYNEPNTLSDDDSILYGISFKLCKILIERPFIIHIPIKSNIEEPYKIKQQTHLDKLKIKEQKMYKMYIDILLKNNAIDLEQTGKENDILKRIDEIIKIDISIPNLSQQLNEFKNGKIYNFISSPIIIEKTISLKKLLAELYDLMNYMEFKIYSYLFYKYLLIYNCNISEFNEYGNNIDDALLSLLINIKQKILDINNIFKVIGNDDITLTNKVREQNVKINKIYSLVKILLIFDLKHNMYDNISDRYINDIYVIDIIHILRINDIKKELISLNKKFNVVSGGRIIEEENIRIKINNLKPRIDLIKILDNIQITKTLTNEEIKIYIDEPNVKILKEIDDIEEELAAFPSVEEIKVDEVISSDTKAIAEEKKDKITTDKKLLITFCNTGDINNYVAIYLASIYCKKNNYNLMIIVPENKGIIDDKYENEAKKNEDVKLGYDNQSSIIKSTDIMRKSAALIKKIYDDVIKLSINKNDITIYVIRSAVNERNCDLTQEIKIDQKLLIDKELDKIYTYFTIDDDNLYNMLNDQGEKFNEIIASYADIKLHINGSCGFFNILTEDTKEKLLKRLEEYIFISGGITDDKHNHNHNPNLREHASLNQFYSPKASHDLLNYIKNKKLIFLPDNYKITNKIDEIKIEKSETIKKLINLNNNEINNNLLLLILLLFENIEKTYHTKAEKKLKIDDKYGITQLDSYIKSEHAVKIFEPNIDEHIKEINKYLSNIYKTKAIVEK